MSNSQRVGIQGQMDENRGRILQKIGYYDMMLESLGKVHEDHGDQVGELVKMFSERKLTLMRELHSLLS